MSLSAESWEQVKALFHAALQMPAEARGAFLAAQEGDGKIVVEVRALLSAFDEAGAADGERGAAHSDASPVDLGDGSGTVIDRYKVLQKIGEGGFGTVFMAEQLEPVRRQVAFKILKAGMDTKRVIARFEAERQALAMMDHQNIARVFDAGSTVTGRPYFVMELVRGVPITAFCDQGNLDTDQRLDLFLQVCSAVQHAHTKGVIHRDIKPSNVLVTLHDGEPVVKVIDFGIAKATAHRLTEHTLFTEFQQMLGTPEYMAPEQAEMSGLDVDTRADIYSLGVLLYEILTGSKPFDMKTLMHAGYEAVLHQIREVDPPKPSTRISTLGIEAATIAKRRSTDARRLRLTLRGDLDWVVMKALAKDRTRRYDTASALVLDIRRFRAHEAVSAGPPSALYRLRKLLRRHRATAIAVVTVLVSLVCGLAAAMWQARIASAQSEQATKSAALATANQTRAEQREQEAMANLHRAVRAEGEAQAALAAERAARQAADGHRLAAQAIALVREDPATALLLAREGHRLAPGEDGRAALYTALERHRLLAELDGHDGDSHLVVASHDGRSAVSADRTNLVLLWDLERRRIRHRIDVHTGEIVAIGLTPDAAYAFSAAGDGTARLWHFASGEEARRLAHPAPLRDACLSPSAHQLFTLCDDRALRRFDLRGDGGERVLLTCASAPLALSRSGDGRRLAVMEEHMIVHVLDVDGPAPKPPRRIELTRDAPPQFYNVALWYRASVELSADGRRVLTRDLAGYVTVWDADSGALVHQHAGPGSFCGPVRLAPGGRMLYLLRRDRDSGQPRAEIVVADTGEVVSVLSGPLGVRMAAVFSTDGRLVLGVNGDEGTLWVTGSGEAVGHLHRDPYAINSPVFLADGERILSGSQGGALHVWAVSAFPERRGLTLPPPGALRFETRAVGPDGNHAVARLEFTDRRPTPIALFDTSSGRAILELVPPGVDLLDARFSEEGHLLAVCAGEPSGMTVWEIATRRPVFVRHDAVAQHVRFARDGRSMVARQDRDLVLYDLERGLETGRLPMTWPLPANLSPGGDRLARVDGPAQTFTVWDVATRSRVGVIEHQAFAFDAVYSPDGGTLVTVGNDGSARVHDAATLELRHVCRVPTADYAAVVFAPDGARFAVIADREMLMFDTATGGRLARWTDPLRLGDVYFSADGSFLTVPRRPGDVRLLPIDPDAWARTRVPFDLPVASMIRYGIGSEADCAARGRSQIEGLVSARSLVAHAVATLDAGQPDDTLALLVRARDTRPRMQARFHYVEACALAVRSARWSGDAERRRADMDAAIAALRRLVQAGYRNADVLETTPHLAPLRAEPAFRELTASLR